MAPAPASPPSRDRSGLDQGGTRSADEQPRPDDGEESEGERKTCGPLDIERHVKDDGRALIIYTRRERKGG